MPYPALRRLGRVGYDQTFAAMQAFTAQRGPATPDELWLLEHDPVYTMGLKGKRQIQPSHIGGTPLVQTDRGGDLTWHGPGQAVVYVLVDLARLGLGIKQLVTELETAVIDLLATHDITGERRAGAPGVYVDGAKIAALGLRVKGGCTYHGLSLNVDPDLTAFTRIDPCGYPGLRVTSLARLGTALSLADAGEALLDHLLTRLGYNAPAHPATGQLSARHHG